MRKFFTFAAAVLATMAMNAATIFGPFTLTAENNVKDQANAVEGGTATVTTVFPTGSSNELTIDDWTFYKFNSSSAVKCALAENATFEVGDSIFVTVAANASSKKTCGVKLNNSITVAGEIPGGQYVTFSYAVVENDGIAGANFFTIYRSSSDSKFGRVRVDRGGVTPPSTDSVATATIAGADSCYVGKSVTLTCTAEHATTYQWYNTNGIIEGATAKTYVFTPDAEGTYGFYCLASNQYNTNPVRSNSLVVTATVKPAAVPCANIIPAAAGDSLKVGDEVDLDALSEGGKIFVAGMKTSKSSISYNALGLMLGGGGADSIRVEFNNLIAEGSVIKLVLAAGGTSERGLNLQTVAKSNQFQAKWTPAAVGEVKEFEYTVPAGSKLIGDYRILLQRNNTVYLQSVSMADCGAARDVPVDTVPVLKASPDSISLAITAAHAADSAVVTFTGKNLAAGNYALTVPDLLGLTITPTAITVGADGKLNAAIKVKYAVDTDVAAASTSFSLTIGELSQTVKVGYSAVHAKQYMSSLNIEQLVLDNGKSYDIASALTAANIAYAKINELDSLNDEKASRNEPYLGLKLKSSGAYIAGWIHANDTISVKFGAVGGDIKARINGQEMTFTKESLANGVLGRRASAEEYLELITTSNSTVVLKQIMINENIQEVILPGQTKFKVTCGEPEHGTVKVGGKSSGFFAAGDTVVVAVTPAEGYHIDDVRYNDGVEDHVITPVNNVYWFIMPAAEVNVAAFFAVDQPVIAGYMVTPDSMNMPIRLTYAATMVQDTLVAAGTTVTMRYEMLDAEWRFEHFVVYKTGDSALVAMNTDSTFIMPEYDVTFTATCVQKEPTQYTVSIAKMTNGQVTLTDSDNQFEAGDTVQLRITPAEGYELETIGLEGIDLAIVVKNGLGTFVMPAQNVTVVATFKLIPVTPMYLVTIAATQNGSVRITNLGNEDNKFYENDVVYISVTPAEGYEIESVSLEGLELAINLDEDGNGSFNMPGQNVTLIATFKPVQEGIDDINADTKAVKRMINGVLVIEKNGKFFNAQGAELR